MTEITLKEEEFQAMIVLKLIQAHARKKDGTKMDPTGAALCTMRMTCDEEATGEPNGVLKRTFKFSFSPKIIT